MGTYPAGQLVQQPKYGASKKEYAPNSFRRASLRSAVSFDCPEKRQQSDDRLSTLTARVLKVEAKKMDQKDSFGFSFGSFIGETGIVETMSAQGCFSNSVTAACLSTASDIE